MTTDETQYKAIHLPDNASGEILYHLIGNLTYNGAERSLLMTLFLTDGHVCSSIKVTVDGARFFEEYASKPEARIMFVSEQGSAVSWMILLDGLGYAGNHEFIYVAGNPDRIQAVAKQVAEDYAVKMPAILKQVEVMSGRINTRVHELRAIDMDIELHYGVDFVKTDQVIRDSILDHDRSGLILLHGLPGTGKTTYIRHLLSSMNLRNVLYLRESVLNILDNGEMTDVLLKEVHASKSVICLIEDGEFLVSASNERRSAGLSTLLNLTDGLLGEFMKVKFIITHNAERMKTDPALHRKGRLIAEHYFDRLPVKEARKLIEHLKFDHGVQNPMTLAEIYHLHDSQPRHEKPASPRIGFGS